MWIFGAILDLSGRNPRERRGSRDGFRGADGGGGPHQWPLTGKSVPRQFGDWEGKILGAKRPKFGAEGAVQKHFSDILEKLFLRNAVKSKNVAILNLQTFFLIF